MPMAISITGTDCADRIQNAVVERPILAVASRPEHVVDNPRDGHLVLEAVDGVVELSAAALDIPPAPADLATSSCTSSDRTSASRLSERMVLCGVSDDAAAALRPHSPRPMAITATIPPTISAARASELTRRLPATPPATR